MLIIACSGSILSCSSVPPTQRETGTTKDRGIQQRHGRARQARVADGEPRRPELQPSRVAGRPLRPDCTMIGTRGLVL